MRMGGPLGDGSQWVSWVHWRDVIDAIDLAIGTPSMQGPYNYVAPNPVRMAEFAHTIALVMDTHSKMKVPRFMLELVLGKERAEVLLTGQRASSKKLEEAGFGFSYPNVLGAVEELIGPK
jgi:NAD dependent epimerase/dehydratase family enzyme